MPRRVPAALAVALAPALAGCGADRLPRLAVLPPIEARIEDRVWLETGPGAPAGGFRAFLSDGTLIAGSCGGPYRLAAWRRIDAARLVWEEADGPVQAEIAGVGPRELVLVDPQGLGASRAYRRAQAPLDCP